MVYKGEAFTKDNRLSLEEYYDMVGLQMIGHERILD